MDEDGCYYWTIDYTPEDEEGSVWLTDPDGNKLLAGASDGTDGTAPVLKVEEDAWWISTDGGESFVKLADCADLDGVGVFSEVKTDDPDRIRLILWDGTELELPRYSPVKVSFAGQPRDTLLIAGGETLPIPFEVVLEGNAEDQPLVVTSGTDGTYFSEIVPGEAPGTGVVKVRAPAAFESGYILLSAYCGGSSAVKMISFRERIVTPSDPVIPVRLGTRGESISIPFEINFEYVLAVSPKDNPDFVLTTFRVYQATDEFRIDTPEIQAPAAGGDFDVWVTWTPERMNNLSCAAREDWMTAEMAVESGFCHVKVHVAPNEGETAREGSVDLMLNALVPVGNIKIVQQAPAAAGE